jgi:hypothetical protein
MMPFYYFGAKLDAGLKEAGSVGKGSTTVVNSGGRVTLKWLTFRDLLGSTLMQEISKVIP